MYLLARCYRRPRVSRPVRSALSFQIKRDGRNHRLVPCVLVAPLGEAAAPDRKGEGRCTQIVENKKYRFNNRRNSGHLPQPNALRLRPAAFLASMLSLYA